MLDFSLLSVLSESRHASSEEAFIITVTKVATGKRNVEFGFSGGDKIYLIYRFMMGVLDKSARDL